MLPKPFVPDIKTVTYEENGELLTYRTREYSFKGARTIQPGFNSYNKADPNAYVSFAIYFLNFIIYCGDT